MSTSKPLKVATFGMDGRVLTMLQMFFAGPGKGACAIVDIDEAPQIGIVDLDGARAAQLWTDYRKRFQGPTLVLSVRKKKIGNAVWVRKPIQPAAFLAAIEEIKGQLSGSAMSVQKVVPLQNSVTAVRPGDLADPSAPAATETTRLDQEDERDMTRAAEMTHAEQRRHPSYGNLPNDVYTDSEQRQKTFYDPDDHLQGILQNAVEESTRQNCPVRISVKGTDKFLTIFPEEQSIQSNLNEHSLRSLCTMALSRNRIAMESLAPDVSGATAGSDPRLQRLNSLMWNVALWSSFGRVPFGTNPEAPVSLKRWPGFTRVFISHHAMRIASLWARRPTSLRKTAETLGIEYRYVYSFYSAAHSQGLLTTQTGAPAALVTESAERANARGLLRRLLGRLSRAA